jgi:hypothetical protein
LVGASELFLYTTIMADQAQAAANAVKEAVNNVTEKVGELTTGDNAAAPTLYTDEVTGEKVSKTERECVRGRVRVCRVC